DHEKREIFALDEIQIESLLGVRSVARLVVKSRVAHLLHDTSYPARYRCAKACFLHRGIRQVAQYDLFISHAWAYDERYSGICRLLDGQRGLTFGWRDYSAPRDHPVADPNTEIGRNKLRALLNERVRQCSCFILVA